MIGNATGYLEPVVGGVCFLLYLFRLQKQKITTIARNRIPPTIPPMIMLIDVLDKCLGSPLLTLLICVVLWVEGRISLLVGAEFTLVGVMAAPLLFVLRSELGVNGVGDDETIVGEDLIENVRVCVVIVVRSEGGVGSLPGTIDMELGRLYIVGESENGEEVGGGGGGGLEVEVPPNVLRVGNTDTLVIRSAVPDIGGYL